MNLFVLLRIYSPQFRISRLAYIPLRLTFGFRTTITIPPIVGLYRVKHNTSFAYIARSITRLNITLPGELMSHFQRSLWNAPFMSVSLANQTTTIPNAPVIGSYKTGIMEVENTITLVRIDKIIFYFVLFGSIF